MEFEDEPKTTEYCVECGESPESGTHVVISVADGGHDYVRPKPPEDLIEPLKWLDLPPPREAIMQWFSFSYLPAGPMREMSAQFAVLAEFVQSRVPPGPEKSTALRKLLEGKDAAVRAAKPK